MPGAETRDWRLGWRLWSPASFAEAIDTRTGDRVRLVLESSGRARPWRRFGPNVGQPDPNPPVHPGHRDLPDLAEGLRPLGWTLDGCASFEIDRSDLRLWAVFADSRAARIDGDSALDGGLLVGRIECSFLGERARLSLEWDARTLSAAVLEGEAELKDGRLWIGPGVSSFVIGRGADRVGRTVAARAARAAAERAREVEREQLSGLARMGHAARWNLCWDEKRRAVFPTVSRAWVEMMANNVGRPDLAGGPLVFGWDAAFSAMIVSRSDPALARAIVEAIVERQQPDGRLPTMSLGPLDADRGAPPVLPLAAWFLAHAGQEDFAASIFPALARAFRWLSLNREPRHDGLFSWGDDAQKSSPLRIDGWAGAAYESGMDDSPLWEELDLDPRERTLGHACVDLTALTALSARALAALAERVGEDPEPYRADFRRIRAAARARLVGPDGLYRNLRRDGRHGARLSPTAFYPLAAGIASREEARALAGRLFEPRRFWGEWVLPSIARDDPAFDADGDYWRGRIWPPVNFLVWMGLEQADPARAELLAGRCRALFDLEWGRGGHVHENQSSRTGLGEPPPGVFARSCPFYCWGGLLLFAGSDEARDAITALTPIDPFFDAGGKGK